MTFYLIYMFWKVLKHTKYLKYQVNTADVLTFNIGIYILFSDFHHLNEQINNQTKNKTTKQKQIHHVFPLFICVFSQISSHCSKSAGLIQNSPSVLSQGGERFLTIITFGAQLFSSTVREFTPSNTTRYSCTLGWSHSEINSNFIPSKYTCFYPQVTPNNCSYFTTFRPEFLRMRRRPIHMSVSSIWLQVWAMKSRCLAATASCRQVALLQFFSSYVSSFMAICSSCL